MQRNYDTARMMSPSGSTASITKSPWLTGATVTDGGNGGDHLKYLVEFVNPGVQSHDQKHMSNMDGARDGPMDVEETQAGRLVRPDITAGSSNANLWHFRRHSLSVGRMGATVLERESAADVIRMLQLRANAPRSGVQRREGEKDVLVAPAQDEPVTGSGNLLTGEWTVPQLAGIGAGLLMLNTVAMKVF